MKRRADCRLCHGRRIVTFLDFGEMPLAGGFVEPGTPPPDTRFPLDVAVCEDCRLVFVPNVVPGEALFHQYYYLASVTGTLSRHFIELADEFALRLRHKTRHLVVEIGSNDGVLLLPLKEHGVRALGIDASRNVSAIATQRGGEVVVGFFGEQLGARVRASHGPADIITASNVFAHIDDMDDVMRGIDQLLAPDGLFVCEVHYLLDLVEQVQFDTIYHEHLCYYSVATLERFFRSWGLAIEDIVRTSIHGGSVRLYVRRAGVETPHPRVAEMIRLESAHALDRVDTYLDFGRRVRAKRDEIRDLCMAKKSAGERLVGYGAAGRGTTLLNYCGLDNHVIDYVVDESPLRAGRSVPGVRVPIVPPARFRGDTVKLALILAWNYEAEIRSKEPDFRSRGGRFIVPLPELRVDR